MVRMLAYRTSSALRYCCALMLAMASCSASAQPVPSSADAGRVALPTAREADAFDVKPAVKATPELDMIPPEQAAAIITLTSVTFKGMSAFTEAELKPIYADKLGARITMRELYALVGQVRQRYMDTGYTLSKVTLRQNSIASGNIVLDVIEGYVGEVVLDPSLSDAPILRSFVEEVKAMRPLNNKRLERLMLVLNARPALPVAAVLSAGNNADGSSNDVVLTLQPRPNPQPRSFVTLDNFGSNFTGPFRVAVGTVIRNLGINYDDLYISGSVATQLKELKQAGMEYTLPIFGVSGATLQFSTSINNTEPGGRLLALEVEGKSRSFSAQASYPVTLQRDESWFVGGGFTYHNVRTNLLNARLSEDQLRTANLTSRYSISDGWGGLNRVQVKASKGLDILGARETGSGDLSRADGHSDFLKSEFSASRLQSITRNVDVLTSVAGQHSNDPLLSSEEFGVGGSGIGRGYDPSEITGDKGISAAIELRYTHAVPAIDAVLQPYGFYDIGKVWNIDPSAKNRASLASAGAGVRLYSDHGWNADVLAAVPLTKPAQDPPGYANGNSARLLMSVRKTF